MSTMNADQRRDLTTEELEAAELSPEELDKVSGGYTNDKGQIAYVRQ